LVEKTLRFERVSCLRGGIKRSTFNVERSTLKVSSFAFQGPFLERGGAGVEGLAMTGNLK
jgi:hypothetical protein